MNNSQGYSFLEESPFHDKQWEMFSHLMATYQLVSMDYTGNLCWDILRVTLLLKKCDRMWDNVLHALFMMLGVSTCITQFLQTQIRNGDHQRNIHFHNREMFFMMRDSKTSNTARWDSCIPLFPPSQVSQLLLELISGGLREAEALLVGVAYGAEARENQRR